MPDGLFSATIVLTYGGAPFWAIFEPTTFDFFGSLLPPGVSAGIAPGFVQVVSQQQAPQTSLGGTHPWIAGPLTYEVLTEIPEPTSLSLLSLGLLALTLAGRRGVVTRRGASQTR